MASKHSNSALFFLAIIGFAIGGLLGFLFRPAAFLIGQLPIETVITRGIYLKGVDRLMIPLAESSFNHMLIFALVGALIGIAFAYLITRR